jgi:hypothetical protein
MEAHNEVMRITRLCVKQEICEIMLPCLKRLELLSEAKRDDPTPEASILSLYFASQDAQKALVMCVRRGR